MTFLRIVIPLYLFVEHDLRANAFRVCREGKPVPTFPDHAIAVMRSRRKSSFIINWQDSGRIVRQEFGLKASCSPLLAAVAAERDD